jgi:NAD(P)-dependent dehydrogenase (short-subunit alcohol dehydrogenase family)
MNLDLTGRLALVSGSTRGIGYAAAEGLAAAGAHVIVNGRTSARCAAAAERIRETVPGATVSIAPYDLAGAPGVAELVSAFPGVDVLVNNVGIFDVKPFEEIVSGVRLSRAYLPHMRAKDWGRIVFVSSESGLNIPVEMVHYGMTKTAQLAVARGIAEGVAGTGITVNSVLPGPTSSEGLAEFLGSLAAQRGLGEGEMEREFFRSARPSSLLQRFATVDEVANAIVYLCSPAASATNGSAMRVDGGVVRSIA